MATTLSKYESDPAKSVGVHVYEPFKPQKPGLITEYVGRSTFDGRYRTPIPVVRVLWIDGKTTERPMYLLQDFDALIADTERKLKTHQTSLQKLQAMANG